ncbi:pyruvate carboxylase [Peptoanaerobacter stomatis]|uniref:Pyruvate carboxylase n=1 Tax=Peptoanaerobacter stomatis TaxID=796937 RepID=V9HQ88_9FIRM|nr:pyruvate carboxylase [Peptoanaerobacter stomatis]EHL17582.1 pyruvate carboxylase [Peptoanaerobacter stomatis]
MQLNKFKRVLVANRGEIAIRIFRACKELGIRTVAVYSAQDKTSLFRTKSDESYQIGKNKTPVDAYLSMDEIIKLAKKKNVDAIHPGYGFLSENAEFAKKCEENGITFIGPTSEMINAVGDKIRSKIVAKEANVPTIPGVEQAIKSEQEAMEFAKSCGYPIMLKASAGGGGRGMRIVNSEEELIRNFNEARSEAKKAFGIDDIFIEKYIDSPKHIEVQILGDKYGNIVHLFERDCSIQRRHQKLIEFCPSISLTEEKRQQICEDAVKLARHVGYINAGTVEFLVDKDMNHYFIEVNPRIQVEHTVTEEITGYDIVQSQILIAQGYPLNSSEIGINSQADIIPRGYAIQCRITTEDPANGFAPDTGRLDVYRSGSGAGIRLDGGNGFTGSIISPYYDSLLVKLTSHSRTFEDAIRKSKRSIGELKISGVKTNAAFLINVLNTEEFRKGECTTSFIKDNPSLFEITTKGDKELKVLSYIGEKIVNETKGVKKDFDALSISKPRLPQDLSGTKQILDSKGVDGLIKWIHEQDKLLITDTTMRDAHQSLIATRVRTIDMIKAAKATALYGKDFFSLEMWGGATFDVAYRFLKESPWKRLTELRRRIPNILFQMLFRGSNAVGYKNYSDNVIKEFIKQSADSGIDIFRIFDSLNWLEAIKPSIDAVKNVGKVAEGTMCYTGDILDETRDKYTLKYYVDLAKDIEKSGADILGIKDMSALLKPYAAFKLIKALKEEVSIPIHLHTHDTSGNGVATVIMAAQAGVDIIDAAISSMSGLTSQPSMNSIIAALEHTDRNTKIDLDNLEKISSYWASLRPIYEHFESDLKSGTTEIYKYEIPGGQYSNLKPQVDSFGLSDKFGEVKTMYKEVNEMLGDIVKVTPSSKMVGDMAIFMVQNSLTKENIYEKGKNLTFPDSVVTYFSGMMGQPEGGFPKDLQKLVLKDEKPITVRPGTLLEDEDFDKISEYLEKKYNYKPTIKECLSYALYPKVYEDYRKTLIEYGELSYMSSDVFFHGIREGETCEVEIADGKILIITLLEIGKLDKEGNVRLSFEVNGNRRDIKIADKNFAKKQDELNITKFANPNDDMEIGASIPGNILKVYVKENDKVTAGQSLILVEAMKMETNIVAKESGIVEEVLINAGQQVKAGELLIRLKK